MMKYKVRKNGTTEFVSEILSDHVEFVKGWDNPYAISFPTLAAATRAKEKIFEIEEYHTTVEKLDVIWGMLVQLK